jgi:hypothetical protein
VEDRWHLSGGSAISGRRIDPVLLKRTAINTVPSVLCSLTVVNFAFRRLVIVE